MRAAVRFALSLALPLSLAAPAFAQGPPMPGPEHEILGRNVGTWDVAMEMSIPGMGPMTMSGVETSTLMAGRWLIADFKGEAMGMTFETHGMTGFDPEKKAYVAVWADTMSTSLNTGESTYDAATGTLKGWMETNGPMGRTRSRSEATWPTADTRVVKIFAPDGPPEPVMTITYTKRK
jgi:hypothetical protein